MDEELQRLRRLASIEPSLENLARLGAAYLRSTSQRDTIRIEGRRWFSRGRGHTYHTARVFINDELVGESDMAYGYGDQYLETGMGIVLEVRPDLPPPQNEAWWRWAQRNNVELKYDVTDVPRRRDL